MGSGNDLARWLAARGRTTAMPPKVPDGFDYSVLIASAERERLLGPLVGAVDGGEVSLPAEAEATLRHRHEAVMLWCLMLERRLLDVATWFDAAGGVQFLVIKGPAIAHLDEPDPGLRSFADLDLLVRVADMDRAVASLLSEGGTRPWPERRAGYDRRFAKSVTITMPDGIEIDLHRSLCDGVHGHRIPLDRIFAQATTFEVGGRRFGAPSLCHRALHSAYHAVLGSPQPKLMSLRDIAGYLARADLPIAEVIAEADRWRGRAVLAEAVGATMEALELEVEEWQRWLRGAEVSTAEVALITRQRREGSSFGPAKLDVLRELDRRGGVGYMAALLWPDRRHLRARDLSRRAVFGALGRTALNVVRAGRGPVDGRPGRG